MPERFVRGCHVPVAGVHMHDGVRDVGGKPLAVRRRHEDVGRSVSHLNGDRQLAHVEAPRNDEGQIVVGPSPDAQAAFLRNSFADELLNARIGEDGGVRIWEIEALEDLRRVRGDAGLDVGMQRRELGDQPLLPVERPAELLDVLRVHAGEPVEAGRIVGSAADDAVHAEHAIREARAHGERVRPTARAARDAEAIDVQRVRQGLDVGRAIDDAPAAVAVRGPVPGPVVRDEANPLRPNLSLFGRPIQAASRRPVQGEDRHPLWIAPLRVHHLSTVGRTYRRHSAPPPVGAIPAHTPSRPRPDGTPSATSWYAVDHDAREQREGGRVRPPFPLRTCSILSATCAAATESAAPSRG
jgi:hypothetical protein